MRPTATRPLRPTTARTPTLPHGAGVRPEWDAYVLTASNAGADRHSAWYLNLLAAPEVTLQVGAVPFLATARSARSQEGPAGQSRRSPPGRASARSGRPNPRTP
ncbi:nitroreductase/quinone reductase family protein [Streptomyces sp. NPDC003032]